MRRRRRVDDAYAAVSELVGAAVAPLGIRARGGSPAPEAAPAGLCFDAHTCYDLLAGDRKIFGSAQRRGGDRFLLHGSLVLAPNPLAAGAVSLEEACGRPVAFAEAEDLVLRAAAETWGVPLVAGEATAEEWAATERLVEERYGNVAWTRRR